MAFKMKGFSPFHQEKESEKVTSKERAENLAYAAKPKWWKTDPHLLKERGFVWDDVEGRWSHATHTGLTPKDWENRKWMGEQRRHEMTTDKAKGGKRLLTDKEIYRED
jgi:hypothetical protein